jgi:hypothetical protein
MNKLNAKAIVSLCHRRCSRSPAKWLNETPRVHHAARRGGVAARGAGAAGRAHAARGVLANATAGEPEAQSWVAAFQQGMQEFGWSVGRLAYGADQCAPNRAWKLVIPESNEAVVAVVASTRRGKSIFIIEAKKIAAIGRAMTK